MTILFSLKGVVEVRRGAPYKHEDQGLAEAHQKVLQRMAEADCARMSLSLGYILHARRYASVRLNLRSKSGETRSRFECHTDKKPDYDRDCRLHSFLASARPGTL